MTTTKIRLDEHEGVFQPAAVRAEGYWRQSSWTQDPEAIGELRMFCPANGRYDEEHPIVMANGETIGHLLNGWGDIGYTFGGLSAGGCFWIAHQTYYAATNSGGSAVTLVGETGRFMRKHKGAKFGKVKSFEFKQTWSHYIKALRLIDNDRLLFYLTSFGFAVFNVHSRELEATVNFAEHAFALAGFEMSPKVLLLAVAFSEYVAKDPVDGSDIYKNYVRLYDVPTGSVVGERGLPGNRSNKWNVEFSDCGRILRVTSEVDVKVFSLTAVA